MQLTDKQKRMALIGAGGLVAVFALLSRGSSDGGGGVDATTAVPAYTGGDGTDPGPTSFADNGAGFGQLSAALSDGFGQLQTTADQLAASDDQLGGRIDQLSDTVAGLIAANAAAPPAQAPPGQLAPIGRPAPTPQQHARATAAGQPIHTDSHGAKRGLRFVTVDRGGQTTRLYETKPGKGNFGATKSSVVGRSKPAAKALPSFKSVIAKTAPHSPVKPKPTPPPKPKPKPSPKRRGK